MPDQSGPAGAVFLSYASQDTEAVERICEALRASGIEVWLDKSELRGGDAWDTQIKRQIHECTLFMPVISAHTNARTEGYFRREWNLAVRRLLDMAHDAVLLVPVVIDETREVDARVPEEFLSAHWTRLPGGETPPAFAQRVRQLLCGDAAVRAAHPSVTGKAPRNAHEADTGWPLGTSRAGRIGLIGFAALVAALLAYGWYARERQAREADTTPDESSLATTELPSRSIAVLAFEDRGGSPGTGVLAEGIPETVLHQLALMRGLTVIARGSSFAFKGHSEDMRVIGRKLNVRYLLEGTVQTAGDRLRVTSSLIDAQTGASVWSKQFNPAAENVFAVQDEIALEVARALKLTLDSAGGQAAGPRSVGTEDYQAYFEFLRGRALLASVRVADLPAAVNALTASIRHDPKFASAYVLLARAKVLLAEQSLVGEPQERFARAIENAMGLLNEAIELDPESGEAYVERGYLKLYFDVAAADADLRRGLALAPNYARGYEGLAAVLFQSVARRREALELVEKARRLDPLEQRLDVIKATYLLFGSGDMKQAAQVAEAVLERDPLYVPALVRLADVRWCGQGQHAESIALAEQAVALDPGNETAWRHLITSYLSVDEFASAEAALHHISDHPAIGSLLLNLYRNEWRDAGEAAYTLIAAGPIYRQIESHVSLAIRRHARVTGDYPRAIETLEEWTGVIWEGNEPVLQGQLDMGYGVAAVADMLMASGQNDRARALLNELLADADMQIDRYGRGEVWLNGGRAIAYALLGRPDDAIAMLQRQSQLGFLSHLWRITLEDEPAFDSLRARKDFQALLADVRANEAREREQFLRMRADGLIPKRS
ncbi:MAG: TIR domain-containing protein [Steroidobacteraceae bacterium]